MRFLIRFSAIWLHTLFWLTLLLVVPVIWHEVDAGRASTNPLPGSYFFLTNLLHLGLFYGMAYGLVPWLLKANRWPFFLICLAGLTIGVYLLKLQLVRWLFPTVKLTSESWRFIFFPTIFFMVAGIIFRLGIDYIRHEREKQQRQSEQLTSELKFLRSQVNPHFLFNVLNNLVALARKKSDLLEPALIKLSGLMRYMLYESTTEAVPLEREFTYLTDYIDLQKLRFDTRVTIQTAIQLPDSPFTIEPMLLIPFVENAFKHGVSLVPEPYISVQARLEQTVLHFSVENRYNPDMSEPKDPQSGIGLANVQKRLDLLYPKRHQLQLRAHKGIFSCYLTLQLL